MIDESARIVMRSSDLKGGRKKQWEVWQGTGKC
jgi:hypothetical protein